MRTKLNYMSERQSVLAQNIANTDTPGYRAKDLAEPDFKRMVAAETQKLPMTATNAKHIHSGSAAASAFKVMDRKSTYEQSPTGNNVTVEEEMMRVAQNQSEYQRTLNLYRKTVSMFKTALGNNG